MSVQMLWLLYCCTNIILSTSNNVCKDKNDCVVPNIENGMDKDRLSLFGDWLDDSIQNNKISGASFAVYRKKSLIYESYHGYHNLNKTANVSKDTVFRIFSMSKPVISVGLMMLWEQNKFQLTDSLSKYIPAFNKENMRIYDYDNNKDINVSNIRLENIQTKAVDTDIKIWNVLTHTSGLSYGFDETGQVNPVDKLYQNVTNKLMQDGGGLTLQEFANALATMPLLFEPGTKYHYSYATDVCGRLIEVISGKALDQYLYENIFKPLNMKHTSFKFGDINKNNIATLYQQTGETIVESTDFRFDAPYTKDYKCFHGGHGLLSTLNDYLSFAIMLLNGGINKVNNKRLLSSETIRFMTMNHLPQNEDIKSIVFGHGLLADFWPHGMGFGLGFGVVLNRRVSDGNADIASEGAYSWGGAADTLFFVDPAKDLCVVFRVQLFPDSFISRHTPALLRFIYASIVD